MIMSKIAIRLRAGKLVGAGGFEPPAPVGHLHAAPGEPVPDPAIRPGLVGPAASTQPPHRALPLASASRRLTIMKHQAAGPDLRVTVFRARYSHPISTRKRDSRHEHPDRSVTDRARISKRGESGVGDQHRRRADPP